jgi:hypothetical protein
MEKIQCVEDEYSKLLRESHQLNIKGAEVADGRFKIELESKQKRLTESLDRLVAYGLFYFAYDIKSDRIIKSGGIQEWLGISEPDFNLVVYNNLFHPALKATQGFYAKGLVRALNTPYIDKNGDKRSIALDIEKTYFSYTQAIKKGIDKNGYMFVKRTLVPFIYTDENRLLGWLNIFNIINEYENHPFIFQKSSFDEDEEVLLHIKNASLENITKDQQIQVLTQMLSDILETTKDRENEKSKKTIENYIHECVQLLNCYALLAKEKEQLPSGNNKDEFIINAQIVAEKLKKLLLSNIKDPYLFKTIGNDFNEKYVNNHNVQILKAVDKKFSYDITQKQNISFNKKQLHVFREVTDFVRFLMEQSILPLND